MKNILLIILVSFYLTSCQSKPDKSENTETISEKTVQITDPDITVALNFINSYVESCNKMKNALGILDWVNSNSCTTLKFKKELKQIIDKAYEIEPELGLDFDPIFNAQDYPKEFILESLDKETGYLIVKGKDWTQFRLRMKLVLEDNKWLVDGCGIINIPKEKQIER